MLGTHLISSGRKFQSEAAAVSINLFPNLTVFLRFGTSDVILLNEGDDWDGTSLVNHINTMELQNGGLRRQTVKT